MLYRKHFTHTGRVQVSINNPQSAIVWEIVALTASDLFFFQSHALLDLMAAEEQCALTCKHWPFKEKKRKKKTRRTLLSLFKWKGIGFLFQPQLSRLICGFNPLDSAVGQRITDTEVDFKVRPEMIGDPPGCPNHTKRSAVVSRGMRKVGQETVC